MLKSSLKGRFRVARTEAVPHKPLPAPSVVLPDVKLPEVGGQLSACEAAHWFSGGNAVAAARHRHHAPGARLRAPSTMRVAED